MNYINKNVIFVQGSVNGAIYDLDNELVYSVNKNSCDALNKAISNSILNRGEKRYLDMLIEKDILNYAFVNKQYTIHKDFSIQLSTVWLEVTLDCNCKCIHCYQGKHHFSQENTLTLNDWKKVVRDLADLKVAKVIVIGGEPCLNNYLVEILDNLCSLNIKTTLFTNGTLINNDIKSVIIRNKDKIKIKMSMYGHNALIHDRITQKKGSFNQLLKFISFLIANSIEVDIAVVAMKENQDFIEDIEKFILELGIKYYGFDIIRTVEGGEQSMHIPDADKIKKLDKHSKMSFYTSHTSFNENTYRNSCWYGKLAITETGDIFPCVFERNRLYGNVKNSSLKNILNSNTLKEMWFFDYSKIDICKDCEFRFSCKDCRPLAISTRGKITDKNPRCNYNPYTGEWSD